jgi:hypothetical protein
MKKRTGNGEGLSSARSHLKTPIAQAHALGFDHQFGERRRKHQAVSES